MIKNFCALLFIGFFLGSLSCAAPFEFEEDRSLPIVQMNIVVDTGAAHDPTAKLGLASVGARMLLRGTEKHAKNNFFQLVDRLGGSIEAQVLTEGTVFRMAVLSENLKPFLALVEEVFLVPSFSGGELDKVKKEIESELLEQKGNDMHMVMYHHSRFFYDQHPYGNPIQGTRGGVGRIFFKDISDYYSTHFGSENLAFMGTGDADQSMLKTWFDQLIEKLAKKNVKARANFESPPPEPVKGRKLFIVDKPGSTQSQILVSGTGIRPENPYFYPIQLATYSFGGHTFNARLMQELRVKRGWTYGAYCSFRYGTKPKHYSIWFFPKTDDAPPALSLSLELLQNFVEKGVTKEEFEFAQKSIVNSDPFNYDTARKRLENTTQEYLLKLPKGFFKEYGEKVSKVKYEDIGPAVRGFYDPKALRITVLGDASKLKPKLVEIPGLKKGEVRVKNYLQD